MVNKKLIAAFAVVVTIAIIATLIAVNFQGWGDSLAGVGGPMAATVYNWFNAVPMWISNGGWPSLSVGMLIFIIAWPIFVAALVWQKDVPYVLGLQKNPNSASNSGYQTAPSQNIIPLDNLQTQPSKKET